MPVVAGPMYDPEGGWRHGWLQHDGARVVATGEDAPPERPVAHGYVLPAPVNAHTHVGDMVGRGVDIAGLTLAQVVAPPDGLKHRLLRDTPPATLLDGMRRALSEMDAAGCRTFMDFRERGVEGVRMLREAAKGTRQRPIALGRCLATFTDEEARAVLDAADGYGHSGLADAAWDVARRASALARAAGKRFALHFSEAAREDVERALDLEPDFVVHGVHCTEDDIERLAGERVPVVLCPRSNARFGPLPDVPAMMRAELPLAIGSDNAMFHPMDVLEDARMLAAKFPQLDARAFVDAAVLGGRLVLDGRVGPLLERGAETDVIVLSDEPLAPGARVVWRSWANA